MSCTHFLISQHEVLRSEISNKGRVSTFFTWKVNLRWMAGGHEILNDLKARDFDHPWWLTSGQFEKFKQKASNCEETERFSPSELNCTLVPRRVISGTHGSRTWLCYACGKLNLCGWMGEQACSSPSCNVRALSTTASRVFRMAYSWRRRVRRPSVILGSFWPCRQFEPRKVPQCTVNWSSIFPLACRSARKSVRMERKSSDMIANPLTSNILSRTG